MSSWLADLRLSGRRLAARPAATLVAILTLSAGIGAVSTMYLLFRAATDQLPAVPAADRLARVWISDGARQNARIPPAPAERRAWISAPPTGISIAEATAAEVTVEPGRHAVSAQYVSLRFFDVLQAQPELGRTFAAGERAVVVSHRLWSRLDPAVRSPGATLSIDSQEHVLTGVMPASFAFPFDDTDAWLSTDGLAQVAGFPYVVARLDPGVTVERAAGLLTPPVHLARGPGFSARVVLLETEAGTRSRAGFLLLAAPALVVLFAVCANVAALLLGDVLHRRRELAIRAALGAGRWRLAREAFADAIVIVAAAGSVSIAAAFWSTRALRAAFSGVSPAFAEKIPSLASVWPMALAVSAIAVAGVGLLPALSAARVRIAGELTGQRAILSFRRGHYGAADLVLIVQIAMSAGLILWASFIGQIFDSIRAVPAYLPADRVWTISVTSADRAGVLPANMTVRLLDEARTASGIESAGVREAAGARDTWIARTADGVATTCTATEVHVAGDYFATFLFPGYGLVPAGGQAVLSDGAVRRCGAAPVEIRRTIDAAGVLAVLGTVDDRVFGAGLPVSEASIYTTLSAPSGRTVSLVVRARSVNSGDARALRAALTGTFPDVRFGEPSLLASTIDERFRFGALLGRLLGFFAAICLLLGIVGLHAAITQALAMRTREIGIRIALGAATRQVVSLTVGHHAAPAFLGVLMGAGLSVAGLMMLTTDDAAMIRQLALRTATSPWWLAAMSALLSLAALLSAGAPVTRALRIDPARILKDDA